MEFDLRNNVGEDNLNKNIIDSIKREIDLLIFLVNDYISYSNREISEEEFIRRYYNIKTHTSLRDEELYNVKRLMKMDDKNFIDNVIDVDNIINGYKDFNINKMDKRYIMEYFKKGLRKLLERL